LPTICKLTFLTKGHQFSLGLSANGGPGGTNGVLLLLLLLLLVGGAAAGGAAANPIQNRCLLNGLRDLWRISAHCQAKH